MAHVIKSSYGKASNLKRKNQPALHDLVIFMHKRSLVLLKGNWFIWFFFFCHFSLAHSFIFYLWIWNEKLWSKMCALCLEPFMQSSASYTDYTTHILVTDQIHWDADETILLRRMFGMQEGCFVIQSQIWEWIPAKPYIKQCLLCFVYLVY